MNKKAKSGIFHFDFFPKNKRADIPVTILVIGVVGLCIFAILSFNFSFGSTTEKFLGASMIEDVLSVSEQISFYENQGVDFVNLEELVEPDSNFINLQIACVEDVCSVFEKYENSKGFVFSVKYEFVL